MFVLFHVLFAAYRVGMGAGRLGRRYLGPRNASAVMLQRVLRGCTKRRAFLQRRKAAVRVQTFLRTMRWYLWRVRYLSARAIQTRYRGFTRRRWYLRHTAAVRLQAVWRGYHCRVFGDGRELTAGRVLRAHFLLMRDRVRYRRKWRKQHAAAAELAAWRTARRRARESKLLCCTVNTVPASGVSLSPGMGGWDETHPRRCVIRCFQDGRRLDRVLVRVFEPTSCFEGGTIVRQDLMHRVLFSVYGEQQQLRYMFNRVTLQHVASMVRTLAGRWLGGCGSCCPCELRCVAFLLQQLVVRAVSGKPYVSVRIPPTTGTILRHGTMRLDGHAVRVRVVEHDERVRIEVRHTPWCCCGLQLTHNRGHCLKRCAWRDKQHTGVHSISAPPAAAIVPVRSRLETVVG